VSTADIDFGNLDDDSSDDNWISLTI
jgi:hypothetical protein